jgi:hypothetical protein
LVLGPDARHLLNVCTSAPATTGTRNTAETMLNCQNYILQETQAVNRFPFWKQVEFNSTFISSLAHHYDLEYNIFSSDVQELLPPCRNPNLKLDITNTNLEKV